MKISESEEKFERIRKTSGFFIAPLLFILILLLPFDGLDEKAHNLLAIILLVVTFWITESIPIPATALLGCVLAVVIDVAPAKEVFSPLGDPIIFLFIGSFIIAESMTVHGLDKRFAESIISLKYFRKSPLRIVFAGGLICAIISMWISNTATTAMMLPIIMSALKPLKDLKYKNLLASAALIVAYSASIGGIATPVGTVPNLITLGILSKTQGIHISFFQWMMIGVPLSLIILFAFFPIIKINFRKEDQLKTPDLDTEKSHPSLTRGEKNTLFVFLLIVFLWIMPGFISVICGMESRIYSVYSSRFHESVVALIGAILLFFLPVDFKNRKFTMTWHDAQRIDWGTIILFGGGLSLGSLMFSTGLGNVLGRTILDITGDVNLWGLTFVSIIMGVLLTEATSNTAATNIVVPVVISLAIALNVSAIPPAIGACFGASMAFMLPISTPPNALAYATGYVKITKMIRFGVLLDITAIILIFLMLRIAYAIGIIS